MNWRKLIYSIVIPCAAGLFFGFSINSGNLSNWKVFIFAILMLVASWLSSTGKGKNGDALSTIVMGVLITLTVWLFFWTVAKLNDDFSWKFAIKVVGLMISASATFWLGKDIMK